MHMHASASLPPYTTIVCNMHASRLTRYGYDYTPALLNCFIQIHSRRQARYQNLFFSQYAWHVTLFTPHTIIFISVCMIEKFLGLSIMSQICLKCPKTAVWSIDLVADWTCRRYWLAEITEMTEHIGTFFMFCCYSLVHYFWCMAMDKIKRHIVTRKGNAMKFTIMEREVGLSSCSSWLGFRIRSECLLKMRYVL